MAKIGWIDFSKDDRNRVNTILELLVPEGMIDELGMGTMRDALANQMFPGISTIQTRAKYFFIIPYILYDYQKLKPAIKRVKSPSRFLDDEEHEVMWQLAEKYKYIEGNGVIGITKKRPERIARRPSTIYWNGLATYQFIDNRGLGFETFLAQSVNPNLESLLSSPEMAGDGEVTDDADAEYENIFRIKVTPKSDWREDLTLDLDREEAEFLRDRILSISKNKLISELLKNPGLWNTFQQSANFREFAKAAVSVTNSHGLIKDLTLAHDFSELMYGAHIAYNVILQQKFFNHDAFVTDWDEWLTNLPQKMMGYESFDPNDLFPLAPTLRKSMQLFIREWWEKTKAGFPDLNKRNQMIERQEAIVKGHKARIIYNKSDDVRHDSWIGLRHFSYRFTQARIILQDILTALT